MESQILKTTDLLHEKLNEYKRTEEKTKIIKEEYIKNKQQPVTSNFIYEQTKMYLARKTEDE